MPGKVWAGLGNALLPNGNKALPEPLLTYTQQDPLALIPENVHQNYIYHIDGLVQERHNFIANALELHLSCTDPLI